jgi:ferredoxin
MELENVQYKNALFYVMSGTGNTYRLACWIKKLAAPYITDIQIVMIDGEHGEGELILSRSTLVGVLFPAHGFMPPWSMIKFLAKMPRQKGVPAMCVATRGGIKVGPLVIPGVAGLGTFLTAIIMLTKGYRPRALFSMDMPSNFINFHWGLHPKNVEAISKRTERKLEHLIPRIMEKNSIYFSRNNLWEASCSLGILWLMPIFPIMYLLLGKLFMAKILFSNSRCDGCGICAKFCPNQAIEMKPAGTGKRPFWTYHCEVCLRCMGYCNKNAVEAGHSWAILLYPLSSIPVVSYLTYKLHGLVEQVPALGESLPPITIYAIDCIAALVFSYWIFWHLMRNPWVNKVFSVTTLTHYYRRYHQPDTKLKDFGIPKSRGE